MPSILGTCKRTVGHKGEALCDGPLCVSSKVTTPAAGLPSRREVIVCCERCGHEAPDHPLLAQEAALRAAPPPRDYAPITPADLGFTHAERLLKVEAHTAALQESLADLRALVASSRKKG